MVNRRNQSLRNEIQLALRSIPEIANLETEQPAGSVVPAVFSVLGSTVRVSVVWAGNGWPTEVREVLEETPHPWPRERIVAARRFSPGSLTFLKARDANWVDQTGSVRLSVPPGLVVLRGESRVDRPVPKTPEFAWPSSGVHIAEILLSDVGRSWTTADLAMRAGWSPAQVSKVLGSFDRQGWMKRRGPKRGRGVSRELVRPGALLDSWSEHLASTTPSIVQGHRIVRDPLAFLATVLAPALGPRERWAATGWVGLELKAPYLSTVPTIQIQLTSDRFLQDASDILAKIEAREVPSGGAIELREARWQASERVDDVPVVSDARLYADLLALGGRAEEGARHLRETRIGF